MANRFQFGLRTLFALTTGLALAFGLIRWHPVGGTMLAILLVGLGWTAGACRAGWRRLAYFLLTLPLGLVAYMLLSMPLSPVTFFLLWGSRSGDWPRLPDMLCMVAATILTAALLRRPIRRPRERTGAGLAAGAAYLGTILYAWMFFVSTAIQRGAHLSGIPAVFVGALVISPVITTLSLHVAWPVSLWFVLWLRKVDPVERELGESEQAVIAALRELGKGRPRLTRFGLSVDDVAKRLGRDADSTGDDLHELARLGIIQFSPLYGYRLYP